MRNSGKRPGLAVAVGATALLLASSAFAQGPPPGVMPANGANPYASVNPNPVVGITPGALNANQRVAPAAIVGGGAATFSSVAPPASSTPAYNPNRGYNYSVTYPGWDPWGGTYTPGGYGSMYGGYGGYGYGYDPFSGFMRGAADILSSSGSFAVRVQESRMIGEQVKQARVDTRRKIFDEWLYERANTPTNQDERERIQRLERRRAMTDPPASEIMAAIPLNILYKDLRDKVRGGAKGQPVVIDEGTLRQINVKSPSAGNVGVLKPLKDGGQMSWPPLLKGEAYQDDVKLINTRAAEAVKQAVHSGEVDPTRLAELTGAINRLKKKLDDNVTELTPAQWIEAKRFLNQLDDARRALSNPDVSNYFTDKFVARGKTVPELVEYMASKGLEFAPAVTGDEASYMALYNYLLAYANSVGAAPGGRDE